MLYYVYVIIILYMYICHNYICIYVIYVTIILYVYITYNYNIYVIIITSFSYFVPWVNILHLSVFKLICMVPTHLVPLTSFFFLAQLQNGTDVTEAEPSPPCCLTFPHTIATEPRKYIYLHVVMKANIFIPFIPHILATTGRYLMLTFLLISGYELISCYCLCRVFSDYFFSDY